VYKGPYQVCREEYQVVKRGGEYHGCRKDYIMEKGKAINFSYNIKAAGKI